MREVFTMWRHTKMVVLVALTAAVYAAILIPVVFSILFGPAAAWGAAFGNLIGDFFGTLGLGSLFGFVGNFFYGFVPYKLCGKMGPLSSKDPMEARSGRQIVEYLLLAFLASAACAAIISWGVDLLRLVPFGVLGPVITLNNFLAAALIGPFLLRLLAPRAKRWNILWTDVVEPDEISRTAQPWMGALLMWIGGIGALAVGVLVSTGLYASLPFQFGTGATGLATVFAILPFLIVFLIGCLLA
jgi:energy-coupling factor transport system substrate-specific component